MSAESLPFVGRAALLERVRRHVEAGQHVLLQGAAGVGKTRLATEVLRDEGLVVRPMDRLLADESRSEVLLGVLAPVGPPTSVTVEDQAAVFGWFMRHWRARGTAGQPPLVWVDDIQHCDPLSAAILRHAVAAGTVQLVATHRTSEPLGEGAQSMVTEGLLVPVTVDPLARPDADALARAAMCARPRPAMLDPPVLDRLHELAAGNPLFLRELVAGVNGGVDLRASTTLVGLIERPLRSLSASCRRTLEIVAVAEPAPERLLVSRRDDIHVLESRGLLARRHGEVRVDHPLRRAWIRRDIGPALPEVLADLVGLVETADCSDEVDPTRLIDWQLQAGLVPRPDDLTRATRLAIARRDGPTAVRFADAVQGPAGDLLRGQALVTSGRLEEGLEVLAQAATDWPAQVRAEAAFARATYLGLMLQDFPGAHAALDAVDDPTMPAEHRRHVISGRLWLCIFGPIGDTDALRLAIDMALSGPDDALAFELCHSTAAVLHQVSNDPRDLRSLLVRCARLEQAPGVSSTAFARWQAVRASWELCQGHADASVGILRAALDNAQAHHDLESVALLAGNVGFVLALTGDLKEAVKAGEVVSSAPPTDDWYSFRNLAELVHRGNVWLVAAGPDPPPLPPARALHGGTDLAQLFATRSHVLRRGARADAGADSALLATLTLLVRNRKHFWAALFGLEVTSLATSREVHELLCSSSREVPGWGLVAVGGAAARARLDGDGPALVRCAHDLEWAGLHALALRVAADASALLAPDTTDGRRARAAVLRAARVYDGRYPRWLDGIERLPTPRQMDVAWRVVDGASATEVARDLVLSSRTVQNHLQRVYAMLGVHGRDELAAILRAPQRPPGWRPGDW